MCISVCLFLCVNLHKYALRITTTKQEEKKKKKTTTITRIKAITENLHRTLKAFIVCCRCCIFNRLLVIYTVMPDGYHREVHQNDIKNAFPLLFAKIRCT